MHAWIWVSLVVPIVLLGMIVGMEWLEQSLRRGDISNQLVTFLDTARPDEVERFVREGYAPALEKYWRRAPSVGARS